MRTSSYSRNIGDFRAERRVPLWVPIVIVAAALVGAWYGGLFRPTHTASSHTESQEANPPAMSSATPATTAPAPTPATAPAAPAAPAAATNSAEPAKR